MPSSPPINQPRQPYQGYTPQTPVRMRPPVKGVRPEDNMNLRPAVQPRRVVVNSYDPAQKFRPATPVRPAPPTAAQLQVPPSLTIGTKSYAPTAPVAPPVAPFSSTKPASMLPSLGALPPVPGSLTIKSPSTSVRPAVPASITIGTKSYAPTAPVAPTPGITIGDKSYPATAEQRDLESAASTAPQQTEAANPLTGDRTAQMQDTTAPLQSPFVQRGTATPAGSDALQSGNVGGSGLFARQFKSKDAADLYAQYTRRLFGGSMS